MPKITGLVHTQNDGLRLGRCLETLYPCDELVVIDHGSIDCTLQVARDYGARIVPAGEKPPASYLRTPWILCLEARESITEALAATLYEWKVAHSQAPAFSMLVREETASGWVENLTAETRLVPADWKHWNGSLPMDQHSALALEGEILRFALP